MFFVETKSEKYKCIETWLKWLNDCSDLLAIYINLRHRSLGIDSLGDSVNLYDIYWPCVGRY